MKYVIGVDFGTLSCRAVLVTQNGDLVDSAVMEYAHGCMDVAHGGVLQAPQDYLDCLQYTVRQVAANPTVRSWTRSCSPSGTPGQSS